MFGIERREGGIMEHVYRSSHGCFLKDLHDHDQGNRRVKKCFGQQKPRMDVIHLALAYRTSQSSPRSSPNL